VACAVFLACLALPAAVFADADEQPANGAGPNPNAGLQPIAAMPQPTRAPGESRLVIREDGTWAAVPLVRDGSKIFSLTARPAPWLLKRGLRVMANTYDGVVPGPTLVVNQGDRVVIDYHNDLSVPDTIHLHGIHGGPLDMDGVAGISQPMVPPGGSFQYVFRAAQPGTFMYHTHDDEAMLDSGLYGAIVVLPKHLRPQERADRDDVELLSAWQIQSTAENFFTINGREYPLTAPIEVRAGQRVRVRWINISGEELDTMRTEGHDQRIIARDAQPVASREVQDAVTLGPGQRVDVIITADQRPGNWLVESDVLAHTEDAQGMPAGLITSLHYAGVPNELGALGDAMQRAIPPAPSPAGGPLQGPLGWATLLGAIAAAALLLGTIVVAAKRAAGRP
jgi:manganese oxidase